MQGVTVIASEEILKYPDWMVYFAIILLVATLVFFIIALATNKNTTADISFVLVCVCGFCAVGMLIALALWKPNIHDYTKYYITVSDETPMLEFNEKYEVLKQHGDLWEVKEIQEDN